MYGYIANMPPPMANVASETPTNPGLRNSVRSNIGRCLAQLDDDERHHQQRRSGEQPDDQPAAPAVVVAAQEPQDQQEQRAGERDQAGDVETHRRRGR